MNGLKKLYKTGIKNKTLSAVSILIAGMMILILFILSAVFKNDARNEKITYYIGILQNISGYLDDYLDEIAAIANESNYNFYMQNYLKEVAENETGYSDNTVEANMRDYEMSSKFFGNTIYGRTDIDSIMLFGKKEMLLYKTLYSTHYLMTDFTHEEWYMRAVGNAGEVVITGPQKHNFIYGREEKSISVSRQIQSCDDGSFLGVVLIDLNSMRIEEICSTVPMREGEYLYIVNEQGEIVYGHQEKQGQNDAPLNSTDNALKIRNLILEKGEAETELNGKMYQTVGMNLDEPGWILVCMTEKGKIAEEVGRKLLFILIVVLFVSVAVLLFLNYILKRIVSPIATLKERMSKVDFENLEEVEVAGNDETALLTQSFNAMQGRIVHLKEQVLKEQADKRKFELQALQAQINPHFLYNTLDSIIWMAEMKDPNVVPMTEALAKLFRISLNRGNERIQVKDELEHVRNYLIIQSMRYPDKFTYTLECSEQAKTCRIIKLIVQPVVENSIYHGIKNKRGTSEIFIQAFCADGQVRIVVKDTGIGMSEEMCRKILLDDSVFENSSGSGIGIKNVNERIKLVFGKEYGLHYKSKLGEWTEVTISLPILKE